ncbi:MAG: hypothetical protein Q8Q36_00435 [bacterium]|nr:hypothetical protein [bacterium]
MIFFKKAVPSLLQLLVLMGAVVFFSYFFSISVSPSRDAQAGTGDTVSGYGWSDNIGWISFNCTNDGSCGSSNYGVTIDPVSGNFSGYAWSENLGWFSFQPADVSGCPTSPCTPNVSQATGAVTGWFRGLANGGGWDGWVHLDGVSASGTSFSGYAWGSDVVGWVDMSGVSNSASMTCSPNEGQVCNSPPNSCGSTNQGTVQCDGSCSAQFPPPDPPDLGNQCLSEANSCGLRDLGTIQCSGSCSAAVPPVSACTPTCASLTASPEVTGMGGSSTLSWNSTCGTPISCVIYNETTGQIVATSTASSGSVQVGPITAVTTYGLTCEHPSGTAYDDALVSPSNVHEGEFEEF